jgi:hypothetical protein
MSVHQLTAQHTLPARIVPHKPMAVILMCGHACILLLQGLWRYPPSHHQLPL